mmetsp:Transcript_11459/g.22072  ORF Transcript_11459/g.22072 Transcript_11459/m.22072 type:complete len:232 (+) Transcript_11459:1425-2120(+)
MPASPPNALVIFRRLGSRISSSAPQFSGPELSISRSPASSRLQKPGGATCVTSGSSSRLNSPSTLTRPENPSRFLRLKGLPRSIVPVTSLREESTFRSSNKHSSISKSPSILHTPASGLRLHPSPFFVLKLPILVLLTVHGGGGAGQSNLGSLGSPQTSFFLFFSPFRRPSLSEKRSNSPRPSRPFRPSNPSRPFKPFRSMEEGSRSFSNARSKSVFERATEDRSPTRRHE